MPTYQRFEDLPVWRAAADLYDRTDDLLALAPPRLSRSFRDQLERAALSVSNNERGRAEMVCAAGAGPERSEGRLGPGALWAGVAATASPAAPPTNSSPSSTSPAAPPAKSVPCSRFCRAAPGLAPLSNLKFQI